MLVRTTTIKLLRQNIFSLICAICSSSCLVNGGISRKKKIELPNPWQRRFYFTALLPLRFCESVSVCLLHRPDSHSLLFIFYLLFPDRLLICFLLRRPTQTINRVAVGLPILVTVGVVQISNYKTNHQWNLWDRIVMGTRWYPFHMRHSEKSFMCAILKANNIESELFFFFFGDARETNEISHRKGKLYRSFAWQKQHRKKNS